MIPHFQIKITTHDDWPVQVDGEPHIQPPGTITILKSALRAKMLKKAKKSRKGAMGSVQHVRAVQSEGSSTGYSGHTQSSHLGVDTQQLSHGKSTPDELHHPSLLDDEEADAFL